MTISSILKKSTPRKWIAVLLIGIALVVFYMLTFSPYPTSDGLTWATNIESGTPKDIRSAHLLYEPLGYIIYHAMIGVGWRIEPILLLQVMNAIAGTTGVIFFFLSVKSVTGNWEIATIASGLLAVSHSYWFYLNCECHVFALMFVMMGFYVLLQSWDRPLAQYAVVGLLHSLAILFHQDNLVFVFVVIAAVLFNTHLNVSKWEALVLYAVVGIILVGTPYLIVGWFAFGCRTLSDYWHWQVAPVSVITTYHPATNPFLLDLLKRTGQLLKGQGVGFTIAVDTLVGLTRGHADYTVNARVIFLLSSLGLIAGLLAYFAFVFFRNWSFLWQKHSRVMTLAFIRIVFYKLIVNSWWVPGWAEYHVNALPPLLLLLALTWVDSRASPGFISVVHRVRLYLAVGLLLIVMCTNFVGAIWPWRQFGRQAVQVAYEIRERSDEEDLVLTMDSSVNIKYWGERQRVSLKEVLVQDSDSNETFSQARQDIDHTLATGHQVFLYGIPPTSLQLRFMNERRHLNGFDPVSTYAFADFLLGLESDYKLQPVLRYWERENRHDTFGNREAILWQVTLRE